MKYYYANAANQPVGPLELAEIVRLAEAGTISEQTHVIAEGSQAWTTYGQLRQSVSPPPPPPAPTPGPFVAPTVPSKGLGKATKIILATAIAAVVVAAAGVVLWETVFNRPSKSLIAACVTSDMGQRHLQVRSVKSQTAKAENGNIKVSYTAEVEAKEPLYIPVDAQGYLRDQMGVDIGKLANAQGQAANVDPSELASVGTPPTDPLSVSILKVGTPAGTVLKYTGTLLATHSEKGWNFTEEGGQYAPAAPQGVARGDVQGQSVVIGNSSDETALKAIVDQANAYADRVAMALPADMPPGVKTIAKLAKAGLSEDAMLTQAHSDGTAYKLTANQIVYLSKVGVPQDVIKALLVGYQPPPEPRSETAEQTPSPNEQPEQEAASAAPPPAPTVTTISLPANFQWLDTGIDLAPGQTVSINASGRVTALFRLTVPFLGTHLVPAVFGVGPDGGGSYNSNNTLDPFVAPGLPAFSLVGKVADSAPIEVGSSSTFPSPAGGRLYLSVNANSFESNLGMWTVTITQGAGPAAEAAPPSQVSFDYFHDQLAPYGNWVQVADYGWAWSPSAAASDPAWRPYADQGQWVYTDAGLYWHSAYPWGDIAFHYGRWTYDSNNGGWLWIPGYDWAPAWVAWRYAQADGYAGWAPLPPSAVFVAGAGLMFNGQLAVDVDFGLPWDAFVFIGYDHFWDHGYRGLFLDRYRVREFYGRSFIRNGYRFENGRFRVEGVGRDRIGLLTHRNVRAVNVHNLRAREEKTHFDARHAQAVRSGARAPERTGENRKAQVRPSGGPANQRQAAPQAKKPSAKPAPASSKKDDKKKGN